MKKTGIFFISLIFLFILMSDSSADTGIPVLKNLNSCPELRQIKTDVQQTLAVIKGKKSPKKLPPLKIYRYTVKKDDTFWKIISATSMDIDTVMTVNNLASPSLKRGDILYIPNMRGILVKNNSSLEKKRNMESAKEYIPYIEEINKNTEKKYIFIPCGSISTLERSLFLGTGFTNPLRSSKKSSGFGTRNDPFNKKRKQFHNGIDLACSYGSKVYAARDGKVSFTGQKGAYGMLIILSHEKGYSTYYGHLSRYNVKEGQQVRRGDVIGYSGSSGRSTGPHLHFEVRKNKKAVNPGNLAVLKY